MHKLSIYLSGNIRKGKEEEHDLVWSDVERHYLHEALAPIIPVFLSPAHRQDDLSDQVSVFGRDLWQISSSQLVLVDARGKRGIGVGAEMMFAKMNRIAVVSWLPENSHYHRSSLQLLGQEVTNYIHPFVLNLSDYLAPTLEQAALWIKEYLEPGKVAIKGPECTQQAIDHFRGRNFQEPCFNLELERLKG